MKIYFAGSIYGGRGDAEIYREIIGHLRRYGEVLTEHVGAEDPDAMNEEGLTYRQIHDRDLQWLLAADVVVADVSTPSHGVGYEVGRAVEHGKAVLCLFRPRVDQRLSAMIGGCPGVTLKAYENLEEAVAHCDAYFAPPRSSS